MKVENYTNNILNGEYKEYYRTGKLKVAGKYVDGLKDGEWVEYDAHGQVVKTSKFVKGKEK
jgi:antitoxin component YwqK of YwqJK toxin-antitoxin module